MSILICMTYISRDKVMKGGNGMAQSWRARESRNFASPFAVLTADVPFPVRAVCAGLQAVGPCGFANAMSCSCAVHICFGVAGFGRHDLGAYTEPEEGVSERGEPRCCSRDRGEARCKGSSLSCS